MGAQLLTTRRSRQKIRYEKKGGNREKSRERKKGYKGNEGRREMLRNGIFFLYFSMTSRYNRRQRMEIVWRWCFYVNLLVDSPTPYFRSCIIYVVSIVGLGQSTYSIYNASLHNQFGSIRKFLLKICIKNKRTPSLYRQFFFEYLQVLYRYCVTYNEKQLMKTSNYSCSIYLFCNDIKKKTQYVS